MEFVNQTRKQHKLILGIGHRVKSVSNATVHCRRAVYILYMHLCLQINNPDMRVVIIRDFVKKHFPTTPVLDYALEVEKITTAKVSALSSCDNHVFIMRPIETQPDIEC